MTLKEFEKKWSDYLASEKCPPVLGLAPLSEEESEAICQIVGEVLNQNQHRHQCPRWRTLFGLLRVYPACLVVWLARKAGEAYEAGAFWEKFGALIGAESIPLIRRESFATHFREACRRTMATWIAPKELGGHNIVAEFLHQAGLPLDRCGSFALHVRKVERSIGLPEADDPEAGEQLREAVLDALLPIPMPTLKRALRGPAGARICEVALNVVLKGDFQDINPRLGRELESVFEAVEPSALRRSAHQPFLRLGDDLGSLEIIGPRQDSSLVGERGVTWIVDGRRHPTPRTDEFAVVVTERPRVMIELAGLTHGNMPPRTFALRLDDLAEPFMLFDERTRKQRRVIGAIPPGTYWLLHRVADTLTGAQQTYLWTEDERALSLFTIRPGVDARLDGEAGRLWSFAATLTPFFDFVGESFAHESGEPIYFNSSQLPFIWLPSEDAEPERLTHWGVHLRCGDEDRVCALARSDEQESGGMTKCSVSSGDFLDALPPGMHRIELTLRRGERARAEARSEYWLWQGLTRHDSRGFQLAESPRNLVHAECRGFTFDALTIRHSHDHHRRHTLTFEVSGDHKFFHWSQPGLFLESLERSAGQPAKPRAHNFGDAFSASINSTRWLKIWLVGYTDWEILVANRMWQQAVQGDVREFVELSLASLSLAFPHGGDVRLRVGGSEIPVARFTSPMQPIAAAHVEDETHSGFRFEFSEPVTWARPVIRELASGRKWFLDGQPLGIAGESVFESPDFPQIECANIADSDEPGAGLTHPLTLRVGQRGWSEGLWLVEIETRRAAGSEWEQVVLRGRDHAPVVIVARPDEFVTDASRANLFWAAFAAGSSLDPLATLDDEGRAGVFELLSELIELRQRSTIADARKDMGWLKNSVRSLSQLAGRIARQPEGHGLQIELLNLACQDASHAGFIYLPGLLALPSSNYRELPTGDPLNDALRRCGSLAVADSVAELVRRDPEFFDMSTVSCFANFMQVATMPEGEPTIVEFSRFDHENYWLHVIGILRSDRLAADWTGEGVLGKAHLVSALDEFVRRHEQPHELHLGAANALMHSAAAFRGWLQWRLRTKDVMSAAAWREPWIRFTAPDAFLEAAPRFASLFALSARAAAAGWLEFDEVMEWLAGRVERRWMAEQGIEALVALAPELFGHQLLFWELTIRTMQVENQTL